MPYLNQIVVSQKERAPIVVNCLGCKTFKQAWVVGWIADVA